VADGSRIDELRRRVQADPASIAFAQLAEELRRAGHYADAADVCRAGLSIHPGYLSARVTLGRALVELNQLSEAQAEFEIVLKSAPDNLAAIRGLAEIHHGRGEKREALVQYRAALELARNDPDLERTVAELAREIEPQRPVTVPNGMSFEQVQQEFLRHAPPPAAPTPAPAQPVSVRSVPEVARVAADDGVKARAVRQVAALEQWLDAIHVVRSQRSA